MVCPSTCVDRAERRALLCRVRFPRTIIVATETYRTCPESVVAKRAKKEDSGLGDKLSSICCGCSFALSILWRCVCARARVCVCVCVWCKSYWVTYTELGRLCGLCGRHSPTTCGIVPKICGTVSLHSLESGVHSYL